MEIEILVAKKTDAAEILALQKRAFQSEAQRYNNFEIAPLKQTLDEIEKDFHDNAFLKARRRGKIVGAVKTKLAENKCWVGRLVVEPAFQRQGIGAKLLLAVERIMPDAAEYFLCTGSQSTDNIQFYEKAGYRFNGQEFEENGVKLVGMSTVKGSNDDARNDR